MICICNLILTSISFLNPPNNMNIIKLFTFIVAFAMAFTGANTSKADSLVKPRPSGANTGKADSLAKPRPKPIKYSIRTFKVPKNSKAKRLIKLNVGYFKLKLPSYCLFKRSEFISKVNDSLKNVKKGSSFMKIKYSCEDVCIRYCGKVILKL